MEQLLLPPLPSTLKSQILLHLAQTHVHKFAEDDYQTEAQTIINIIKKTQANNPTANNCDLSTLPLSS